MEKEKTHTPSIEDQANLFVDNIIPYYVKNQSDIYALQNGCYFDEEAGNKVVNFIEAFCKFTEGEKFMKPFVLEEWQKQDLIMPLYGWMRKNGLRRFKEAFIFIGRGNGKTALLAALSLYHLLADGILGAEVINQASTNKQAGIAYRSALEMVEKSDELSSIIKPTRASLHVKSTNSVLQIASGEKKGHFGARPSAIFFDELHEQPDDILFQAHKTSLGKKKNSLLISTTTAGWNRNSLCFRKYELAKDILSGKKKQDSFFALIYEADPNDDISDPKTWKKANPNLDISIDSETLKEEVIDCQNDPTFINSFLRDRLNIWTTQHTRWIDGADWQACSSDYTPEDLKGRKCFGGYDGSFKNDLSSFSLAFPPVKKNEPFKVLTWNWVPEDSIPKRSRTDNVLYDAWYRDGFIRSTPGSRVEQEKIMKDICEIMSIYNFNLQQVGYDEHGSDIIRMGIEKLLGKEMFYCSRGYSFWSKPMKKFYTMMLSKGKELVHNNSPVLAWCLDNLVVKVMPSGDIMPAKDKCREKIDAAISMIIALDQAVTYHSKTSRESVYESRGIMLI